MGLARFRCGRLLTASPDRFLWDYRYNVWHLRRRRNDYFVNGGYNGEQSNGKSPWRPRMTKFGICYRRLKLAPKGLFTMSKRLDLEIYFYFGGNTLTTERRKRFRTKILRPKQTNICAKNCSTNGGRNHSIQNHCPSYAIKQIESDVLACLLKFCESGKIMWVSGQFSSTNGTERHSLSMLLVNAWPFIPSVIKHPFNT